MQWSAASPTAGSEQNTLILWSEVKLNCICNFPLWIKGYGVHHPPQAAVSMLNRFNFSETIPVFNSIHLANYSCHQLLIVSLSMTGKSPSSHYLVSFPRARLYRSLVFFFSFYTVDVVLLTVHSALLILGQFLRPYSEISTVTPSWNGGNRIGNSLVPVVLCSLTKALKYAHRYYCKLIQ